MSVRLLSGSPAGTRRDEPRLRVRPFRQAALAALVVAIVMSVVAVALGGEIFSTYTHIGTEVIADSVD